MPLPKRANALATNARATSLRSSVSSSAYATLEDELAAGAHLSNASRNPLTIKGAGD